MGHKATGWFTCVAMMSHAVSVRSQIISGLCHSLSGQCEHRATYDDGGTDQSCMHLATIGAQVSF